MANVIKLHKGLDIHLQGKAEETKLSLKSNGHYALVPDDFVGVTPKVVVREGDTVKAGDALFVNKLYPEVRFASPVSGKVTAVERGERRKVLCIKVEADKEQHYADFGRHDVAKMDGQAVKELLLNAGLFGYINQLPYAVSANPVAQPKAIFVSALRDKPLAASFDFEVKGQEPDFVTGLQALAKIAKVHVGVGPQSPLVQSVAVLQQQAELEVTIFDGPCPAGNVGVQVNHLDPVAAEDFADMIQALAGHFRCDIHSASEGRPACPESAAGAGVAWGFAYCVLIFSFGFAAGATGSPRPA